MSMNETLQFAATSAAEVWRERTGGVVEAARCLVEGRTSYQLHREFDRRDRMPGDKGAPDHDFIHRVDRRRIAGRV